MLHRVLDHLGVAVGAALGVSDQRTDVQLRLQFAQLLPELFDLAVVVLRHPALLLGPLLEAGDGLVQRLDTQLRILADQQDSPFASVLRHPVSIELQHRFSGIVVHQAHTEHAVPVLLIGVSEHRLQRIPQDRDPRVLGKHVTFGIIADRGVDRRHGEQAIGQLRLIGTVPFFTEQVLVGEVVKRLRTIEQAVQHQRLVAATLPAAGRDPCLDQALGVARVEHTLGDRRGRHQQTCDHRRDLATGHHAHHPDGNIKTGLQRLAPIAAETGLDTTDDAVGEITDDRQ